MRNQRITLDKASRSVETAFSDSISIFLVWFFLGFFVCVSAFAICPFLSC